MLVTYGPRLIEITGSLAVVTGRAPERFEYQILCGIRPAGQPRLARTAHVSKTPSSAQASGPLGMRGAAQAMRTVSLAVAGTRASGRLTALSAVDRGRAGYAHNGTA